MAQHGWERVILLLNESFGSIADLPFDFDRQRVTRYRLDDNATAKERNHLTNLLGAALGDIIRADPASPRDARNATPEQVRRARDLESIWALMSAIHLPTLETHIEEAPEKIADQVLHFLTNFDAVFSNALFRLNDPELAKAFEELHRSWHTTVSYDQHYRTNADGTRHIFGDRADALFTAEQAGAYNRIKKAIGTMRQALDTILDILKRSYHEVDVWEASRAAWREYVGFTRKHSDL